MRDHLQAERRKELVTVARKPVRLPRGISKYPPLDPGGPGRYRVRIQFKGRQTSAGVYETLAEAKEAQKHYRRQVMLGTFIPISERHRRWNEEREAAARRKVTVADYAAQWIQALSEGPKPRKATTLVGYQNTLDRHIIPAIGNQYLTQVKQETVDKLLQVTEKESGPAAARNVAGALRAMFNHALKEKAGGMTEVPFTVTVSKARTKSTDQIPTPDEVLKAAALMPEPLRLAPVLAAMCALRPAELLGLRRGDLMGLDTDNPRLRVERQWLQKTSPPGYGPPKYDSVRTVGIPTSFVPQIQAHLDLQPDLDDDAPLFPSPKNPLQPVSPTNYREKWNAAQKAAGVGPFVLHSLRHLGLTLTAVVGGTNAEVMARGGHTDAKAAARYQHQLRGRDRELTEALGKQWEGVSSGDTKK